MYPAIRATPPADPAARNTPPRPPLRLYACNLVREINSCNKLLRCCCLAAVSRWRFVTVRPLLSASGFSVSVFVYMFQIAGPNFYFFALHIFVFKTSYIFLCRRRPQKQKKKTVKKYFETRYIYTLCFNFETHNWNLENCESQMMPNSLPSWSCFCFNEKFHRQLDIGIQIYENVPFSKTIIKNNKIINK